MPGFSCERCGYDLSLRIELLALAVKADYPDGDYPDDFCLDVDGVCDSCSCPFHYSGEMFTHFITSKVEEGVIDPKTRGYTMFEIDMSDEDSEEFKRLLDSGDETALRLFLIKIMRKPDR